MNRKIKRSCIVVLTFIMLLNPRIVYAGFLETKPETEDNVESESEVSETNQEGSGAGTKEDKIENEEIENEETKNEETENETGQITEERESSDNMIQSEEDISIASDAVEETGSRGYQGNAVNDTGNTANVVVFVEFADTVHDHLTPERCYLKDPKLIELFQGDASNPRAMKKYLQNISYGQLEVANIFPQYDAATDKIDSYALQYGVDHYADSKNGDTEIIDEVADILASSGQISSDISLDRDNDGYVDNLMIVVPCESGDVNKKFYGHQSRYIGSKSINSKKIFNYTVVPESSVYATGTSGSGVLIHEFLHTKGYPDLYLVGASDLNKGPVGPWDIMATASKYVQYPLAYFRSAYSNWFSIPTVRDTTKGYSLYAASAATAQTKDRQAVILKTGYSSTEFFVLEYRKKGEMYNATSAFQAYDSLIPASGLIIYRINTSVNQGNAQAPPYMAYVFRQNDTYENGYEKADKDLLDTSVLSAESGRTSFGSSDANASVTENAICYSDGMNSGIVISNVGKTDGDQITFDITFTEEEPGSKWVLESEDTTGLQLSSMDSCRSQDGSAYYISQIGNSSSGGSSALLKYSGGKWSKVADGPVGSTHKIVVYNNEIYVLYRDSKFYVKLDKWTGKGWSNIFTSAVRSNDITMRQSDNGVFFAFTNWEGNTILAYKYSGDKGLQQLGDKLCYSASGSPTNTVISSLNGNTVAVYREAAGNKIYVKKYNETTNSWSVLLNGSMQANNAVIEQNGNSLYLLQNGTVFGNNQSYLYVYDMSSSNGKWTQVGTNMVMDSNTLEMNICFNGSQPYVIYSNGMDKTYARQLTGNQWAELGLKVSSQQVTGLGSYYESGKVYVTYLDLLTSRISIRALQVGVQEEKPKLDGWYETGGKKYYYEDGKMMTGWKDIDGKRYYFMPEGYMWIGWAKFGSTRYYFMPEGYMWTGWAKFGSTKYYFDADGKMLTGWQDIDGARYFFMPEGYMWIGWAKFGSIRYYFDADGKMVTGQKVIDGKEYFFNASGVLEEEKFSNGWKTEGGYTYYYENGKMVTGWKDIDGKRYYFMPEGYMWTGWAKFGSVRYYFMPEGYMWTGWAKFGSTRYYFDADGKMLTGWQDIDGKKYFFMPEGYMWTGWAKFGSMRYYFMPEGYMWTGWAKFGSAKYYFDADGKMLTGWQDIDGARYFFMPEGYMWTGWAKFGSIRYYFDADGKMVTGQKVIDGKEYFFNASGVLE